LWRQPDWRVVHALRQRAACRVHHDLDAPERQLQAIRVGDAQGDAQCLVEQANAAQLDTRHLDLRRRGRGQSAAGAQQGRGGPSGWPVQDAGSSSSDKGELS